jgi:hypothetical protein
MRALLFQCVSVSGRARLPVLGLGWLSLLTSCVLFAPTVASAETCPNAEFRTGLSESLPDCRAYEMVTPPYKDGYRLYLQEISTDGSRILGNSFGNFAGTENSLLGVSYGGGRGSDGAEYLFTRTGAGWVTSAITLPASRFPLSADLASSTDLESSLWFAATPSQQRLQMPGDLYLREQDGSLAEIGPVLPPGATEELEYAYHGASNDLSHVLFSLQVSRWPGDSTLPELYTDDIGGSLYEYVGTGNSAPLLVGVGGGAESTSLISRCGTVLGWEAKGESGQEYEQHHAISATGEVIFFTALSDDERGSEDCPSTTVAPPVDELFARIGNGSADAHTVAISEPSSEDCSACDTAVPTAARFAGASEDGSKVFFTTTQPLLGSTAETSDNLYEYDFDAPPGQRIVRVSAGDSTVSSPVASVRGEHEEVRVSEDGSHVYFIAGGVLTRNPNSLGEYAQPGAENLYVFDTETGTTAFIAAGGPGRMSLSPDGRFLVFTSTAHLTSEDTAIGAQVFEYDAQTGALVRVSIGQNGSYNDDGNAPCGPDAATGECAAQIDGSGWGQRGTSPAFVADQLTMSEDGSEVFFESPLALTPQAMNGVVDGETTTREPTYAENVYEYRGGNVYLISDGQDSLTGEGALSFVDASGADVIFGTHDHLSPQDGDTQVDFYDARVGGGFPPPPTPSECEGDACQGQLSGTPVLLSPGSEFQAGGNPPLASAGGATTKRTVRAKAEPRAKKKKAKAMKRRKSVAQKARRGSGKRGR